MEKHPLAAQVKTSDCVENVDDDEVEVDAHGCQCLASGPEAPAILFRMHERVRISKSWNVFGARSSQQVRIHTYLMHFWWWQD